MMFPYKMEKFGDNPPPTHTQCHVDDGRNWGVASISQGTPKLTSKPLEARQVTQKRFSPKSSQKEPP